MKEKIALVAIIVEDQNSTEKMNAVLHEYRDYIIGRIGIPYRKREISIISIALDAPDDVINSLSEKLETIKGINTKTVSSVI